jgi:hypothetical protein
MSFAAFLELCGACYVSREDVEVIYNANPNNPWSSGSDDYTNHFRQIDATNFLNDIFMKDELDLFELSERINAYRQKLIDKKVEGPIWSTIGNIRSAAARAAAESFRKYVRVLPDPLELSAEDIRSSGKPSPYRNMQIPVFDFKPEGGLIKKNKQHADYQAAVEMYHGDFLALLIAREYDIEEYMP